MIHRTLPRFTVVLLAVLVILSILSAFSARVTVPVTRLSNRAFAITANTLKPPQCAALTLTGIIVSSNTKGTANNDLIIGTAGADNLGGSGGSDCIIGGGEDDILNGGKGNNDVCIGGPGNDTIKNCDTAIQ